MMSETWDLIWLTTNTTEYRPNCCTVKKPCPQGRDKYFISFWKNPTVFRQRSQNKKVEECLKSSKRRQMEDPFMTTMNSKSKVEKNHLVDLGIWGSCNGKKVLISRKIGTNQKKENTDEGQTKMIFRIMNLWRKVRKREDLEKVVNLMNKESNILSSNLEKCLKIVPHKGLKERRDNSTDMQIWNVKQKKSWWPTKLRKRKKEKASSSSVNFHVI